MTVFGTPVNEDPNGVKTTAVYGDRGDGTSEYYETSRVYDGGDVAQGATTATAVTDPTVAGSVIALLKGILTFLRVSAAGLGKAEDAAHVSGDTGVMALAVRNDARTALAGASGDYSPMAVGPGGGAYVNLAPAAESAWSPSQANSAALAASLIVKASAGKLFKLRVTNTLGSTQYIQLHNSATLPADTAVPVAVMAIPTGVTLEWDFTVFGRYFTTGIVVCNSTTVATKTIGAADCWFDAIYY